MRGASTAVQEERKKVVENSVPTHWIAEHHDRAQVGHAPLQFASKDRKLDFKS